MTKKTSLNECLYLKETELIRRVCYFLPARRMHLENIPKEHLGLITSSASFPPHK